MRLNQCGQATDFEYFRATKASLLIADETGLLLVLYRYHLTKTFHPFKNFQALPRHFGLRSSIQHIKGHGHTRFDCHSDNVRSIPVCFGVTTREQKALSSR